MRIVVANEKGGVGKTTTAVFLSEVAAEDGASVLLVDCDPQGSTRKWADYAAEAGLGLRAITVAVPTSDLRRQLGALAAGYDHVILDTPPGHPQIIQAAIDVADIVLIPCQPTAIDVVQMRSTIDLAQARATPAVVLLTRTVSNTRLLDGTVGALDAAELPVLPTPVPQRQAIAAAFGIRPQAPARGLYKPVWDELFEVVAPLMKETVLA
jgi:chromosome partitioning protein